MLTSITRLKDGSPSANLSTSGLHTRRTTGQSHSHGYSWMHQTATTPMCHSLHSSSLSCIALKDVWNRIASGLRLTKMVNSRSSMNGAKSNQTLAALTRSSSRFSTLKASSRLLMDTRLNAPLPGTNQQVMSVYSCWRGSSRTG